MDKIGIKRGASLGGYASLLLGTLILQVQNSLGFINPTFTLVLGLYCLISSILVFVPVNNPQIYLGPFKYPIRFATEVGWVVGYAMGGLVWLFG